MKRNLASQGVKIQSLASWRREGAAGGTSKFKIGVALPIAVMLS